MRNFLRNKEIKVFIALALLVAAGFSALGFLVSLWTGVYTALASLILLTIFLLFTKKRYARIAALSEEIDRILHNDERLEITSLDEGELSILQSELAKMIVRLREQADNLQKDKRYLSESLEDISHQIRTPLTSINILVSLLTKEGLEPVKRQEFLRETEALLLRIEWMVTTLLRMAKLEAGAVDLKSASVRIEELVSRALEPFVIQQELHNLTIEKVVSGSLDCDLFWTAEALSNIIKNCLEHVADCGCVRIESTQNSIYTEIVISDDGEGFLAADIPHLFDRHYQGQRSQGKRSGESNYGLGLALSKKIINEQNGTIKAMQNQPSGARFIIKFYRDQAL